MILGYINRKIESKTGKVIPNLPEREPINRVVKSIRFGEYSQIWSQHFLETHVLSYNGFRQLILKRNNAGEKLKINLKRRVDSG